MTTFHDKYMTSYLIAIVMFALSFTVNEMFANQIKCKQFDVENDGQGQRGEKRDLYRSTGNVLFLEF